MLLWLTLAAAKHTESLVLEPVARVLQLLQGVLATLSSTEA